MNTYPPLGLGFKNGLLTWRPNLNQAGEYTLNCWVYDLPDHPKDWRKTDFTLRIKVIVENLPPELSFLIDYYNIYLIWHGTDQEDGANLTYSHRIDGGAWSAPSAMAYVYTRDLKVSPGRHTFEIKAIDTKGLQSGIRSVDFVK